MPIQLFFSLFDCPLSPSRYRRLFFYDVTGHHLVVFFLQGDVLFEPDVYPLELFFFSRPSLGGWRLASDIFFCNPSAGPKS